MKECKCGRIPPCYGGKKFRIHEELEKIKAGDDTHEMVYELNKQMCDLGKTMNDPFEPLSEEAIQDIAKALEITRNPKSIMEEKKTKKMTKAEAFEYLKHKKVNAKGVVKEIQKKLFEIGYTWCDGSTDIFVFVGFFLIDDETFQFTESLSHFKNCAYEEISADDILSLEIVEDKNNEFVDCSEPCPEIKAVQELLRNSKFLKDKIVVITKDNAAVL